MRGEGLSFVVEDCERINTHPPNNSLKKPLQIRVAYLACCLT